MISGNPYEFRTFDFLGFCDHTIVLKNIFSLIKIFSTFPKKSAPGRTQLNGIDFRSRFLKTETKFFETVKFEKSVIAEVYLVQI